MGQDYCFRPKTALFGRQNRYCCVPRTFLFFSEQTTKKPSGSYLRFGYLHSGFDFEFVEFSVGNLQLFNGFGFELVIFLFGHILKLFGFDRRGFEGSLGLRLKIGQGFGSGRFGRIGG